MLCSAALTAFYSAVAVCAFFTFFSASECCDRRCCCAWLTRLQMLTFFWLQVLSVVSGAAQYFLHTSIRPDSTVGLIAGRRGMGTNLGATGLDHHRFLDVIGP